MEREHAASVERPGILDQAVAAVLVACADRESPLYVERRYWASVELLDSDSRLAEPARHDDGLFVAELSATAVADKPEARILEVGGRRH